MNKHNYHYIRYAVFIAYMAALTQIPGALTTGIEPHVLGIFGAALTIVCMVIDWRNYYLWLEEENKQGIGPVTITLALFYFLMLLWFISLFWRTLIRNF